MRKVILLLVVVASLACKNDVSSHRSESAAVGAPPPSADTMASDTMAPEPPDAGAEPPDATAEPPAPAAASPAPTPPRPRATVVGPAKASPRPRKRTSIREVELRDYVKVPVYYAATRKRDPDDLRNVFGAGRGKLHYGVSWVSIPRSHEAGELEEPSVFTFTFREDPAKHVVLLEVKATAKERWHSELNASIREAGANQAFVFIHGYNVAFADASRRTAQIKYDLGFDGPAILFSWPSHGKKSLYLADEANAEWSAPQFAEFLVELRRQAGPATQIHLIAHSLGNRVLSRAIERIDIDPAITPKPTFSQIVLAAPDMDADVFREQLAPRMRRLARGITLYGSSDDRALQASRTAHQVTRAGEGGENLPIIPGIDSVDVTGLDTSFLAHSYIGAVSVLGDVAQIFCEGKAITQRFGLVARDPAGWMMVTSQEKREPRPCRGLTAPPTAGGS
jgi:esterase/lipase superfamily enzyme